MAGTMHTPDHATGAAISLPTALEFFGDMSPAAPVAWVLTVVYTLMKMYDWWRQHKAQESQRLQHDAAVRELLGAINYLAGAVIWLESHRGNPEA